MDTPLPASPLQPIAEHPGNATGITLFVKRDDLLHPDIQGNKWRKLAPVLDEVKQAFPGGIVTFGGPFSNHLQAVAAAGRVYDFPTFGIVRGLHTDLNNPTLRAARYDGMQLFPVSKQTYDEYKQNGWALAEPAFAQCYILPEGGATAAATAHCGLLAREIVEQLRKSMPAREADAPLFVCVPAGTGCTAAGLVDGLEDSAGQVLVFPVVNRGFDAGSVLHWLDGVYPRSPKERAELERRFSIVRDYEFGGFAKKNALVLDFEQAFQTSTGILLDPVYTAKMLYGIWDMLANGCFPPSSTVVAVHTGGLQGWAGFLERYGVHLKPENTLKQIF
ncbi:MAG: pyridoxal-phosphate dependent enzyme [Saprospiraceae bacterium]